ncbi:MAG: hypothetical protein KC475_04905 [Cyanobacteria bacterium HKST-UBA03]|nr:hypothetical protein [Cyanobacteria bacterium HKST-UBA03]
MPAIKPPARPPNLPNQAHHREAVSLRAMPAPPAQTQTKAPPPFTAATAQRLFAFVSPLQAVTLFLAGVAAAFPVRWFAQGLKASAATATGAGKMSRLTTAAEKLPGQAALMGREVDKIEQQKGMFIQHPLLASTMMALRDPSLLPRLKAFFGASVTGYLLGSGLDGVKEVMVRREETQIRANVLRSLTSAVQRSIQGKTQWDDWLRQHTRSDLQRRLKQAGVDDAQAKALVGLAPVAPVNLGNYPYEPTHFSAPLFYGGQAPLPQPTPFRFGHQGRLASDANDPFSPPNPFDTTPSAAPPPGTSHLLKTGIFATGLAVGSLGQGLIHLLRQPASHGNGGTATDKAAKLAQRVFFEVTNIHDWEAMFLMGSRPMLLGLMGLAAAAKVGKTLVDGYREIEVTRQNAQTEVRYQQFNWQQLDPAYHRIAEWEAMQAELKHFDEALPMDRQHPDRLKARVDTLLANVGRNSAPKYYPMTPSINLVDARS